MTSTLSNWGRNGPALPERMHLSWASKRLMVVGTTLMVAAGVALVLMIWKLHQDALGEARQNTSMLGIAIAEQTSRSVQAGDVVLEELRQQIAKEEYQTVDEFKAGLASESLFRHLKDRAEFLPQVDAFTIIAADGKLVNFSRQWPVPATDLSDRDYLAFFREHDAASTFISAPVQNRGTGSWTTYIVRRVNSRSGLFLGMVLAAIDLDYYKEFFKALTERSGTTVTLLKRDGTALISYPATARIGDVLPKSSPWYRIVQGATDVFETQGVLAPGLRIVSVHPLHDYPLVINVSLGKRDALAGWTRIALVVGICSLLAVAFLILLVRAQFQQFRRLELSERLLGEQNATLRRQAGELSASRAAVAEQSAALQAALTHMNQGIIMVDADGRVAVCNERAAAMLDLPAELVAARSSLGALIAHQRGEGEFEGAPGNPCTFGFEEAFAGPRHHERERPNGRLLEVQTVPMPDGGMVRTYSDITERRRSELQIKFLASHDSLTGLFDRTGFQDRFDTLMAEAARRHQRLAVLYLDLDGFKLINDTHGHATGDELLVAVAERLRAAVRDTDVLARMGGDEFAVIQPVPDTDGHVAELAGRIIATISEPFRLGPTQCSVSLSIGIALYPEHAATPADLLKRADLALYRAKAGGKRAFCLFDPVLDLEQQSAAALQADLARALAERQLHLEYQPIVDANTLDVVRFEALLRWDHPERGRLVPADFIEAAERAGLMLPIGQWVLETACAAAASWTSPVEISVNLSPMQFARGDLVARIEHILQQTGLAPWRLNLEVTEAVLLASNTAVAQAITELKRLGIRFTLDDFGSGHAGLTFLRRYPFDVLKVAQSIVRDAADSNEARTTLGSIQAIGSAYRLQVVAEGVETEQQLETVRDVRCSHVQGFLTGPPASEISMGATGSARPAGRPPRLSLVQPS